MYLVLGDVVPITPKILFIFINTRKIFKKMKTSSFLHIYNLKIRIHMFHVSDYSAWFKCMV